MEFFGSDKFKVMMGFMVKLLKNNKDGAGFFVGNKVKKKKKNYIRIPLLSEKKHIQSSNNYQRKNRN